jgi:hypothetical protein
MKFNEVLLDEDAKHNKEKKEKRKTQRDSFLFLKEEQDNWDSRRITREKNIVSFRFSRLLWGPYWIVNQVIFPLTHSFSVQVD